jgi:hypothetical protein
MNNIPPQKKRGRRKKEEVEASPVIENNIIMVMEEKEEEPVAKKRGRRPKGGKLVLKPQEPINIMPTMANIILHLKCSLHDLNEHNTIISKLVTDPLTYNPVAPPTILTYNNIDNAITQSSNDKDFGCNVATRQDVHSLPFSTYTATTIENTEKPEVNDVAYSEVSKAKDINNLYCHSCSVNISDELNQNTSVDEDADVNIKDINTKLKRLKIQLYKNMLQEKKSACFWCTYEYDNPTCYIPKYEIDTQIYGYGSFCRPECAVAYLMKENIDDSTKFERYHLLNQIYSKVYDYKKNIKPAPNPYYLLDKFYGNMTIQEYRKLLKTEHMLLVIDKPMTRILPELHEDSEDFIMNIYGTKTTQTNQTGVYKVKRESDKQKGPSKASIMKECFGI